MFVKIFVVCAALLISVVPVFSIGKTAVITLQFPHGAENCGMGEVGVSLADNINSVFWNPAALPAIGKQLSVQYVYSHFNELLLPSLHIKDLEHSSEIHAVFITNLFKNIDFGLSYSVNHLSFGMNEWRDENDIFLGRAYSDETVRSLAIGGQYADIISLGAAIKDVESRLAPGYNFIPHNGIALAQVFDAGIRLEKKFTIADAFDIHPAIGCAVHSFPRDQVTYIHDDTVPYLDPLPLTRWYGASIKFNALDFFGITFAKEREYYVIDQEFNDHKGWKFQITPIFAYLIGAMDDSAGNRFEHNHGYVFTLNYQQSLNALIRFTDIFSPGLNGKLRDQKKWAQKHHLKPNVHLQYTRSSIHTHGDNNVREGQTRKEWSMGISLIGDLSAIPSLKNMHKNQEKPAHNAQPPVSNTTKEEDTELVE
jgi:hypothetical protein